jgi:hypothetical protein
MPFGTGTRVLAGHVSASSIHIQRLSIGETARRRCAATEVALVGRRAQPVEGSALTLDAEGLADEQKGRGRQGEWGSW